MSESKPTSDTPKPSIPKPNIPAPNIPAPNIARQETAPPISAVESGAMEQIAQPEPQPTAELLDESFESDLEETILHKRLLGGLIDYLLSLALLFIARIILPSSLDTAAWALQIGYMLTRDALPFFQGRSIGKMAMGLRVVGADGEPLIKKWEANIIRNVPFAFPIIFPFVEMIVLYKRENDPKQGLRLGDDFAKTKVITSHE